MKKATAICTLAVVMLFTMAIGTAYAARPADVRGIQETAGMIVQDTGQSSLIREEAYTRMKGYGMPLNQIYPILDELAHSATSGVISEPTIDAGQALVIQEFAPKAGDVLRAYAETFAYGRSVTHPQIFFGEMPEGMELRSVGGERTSRPDVAGQELMNNGTCLSCPSYDFGPFTPTGTCTYHSEATESGPDCNMYLFNVTAGVGYEWTFCNTSCASASATFDTYLYLYDAVTCNLLASNDDSCGLQSHINWTSSFTGQVILRVASYASSSFGSYTLGYRTVQACETCALPGGTIVPSASCQYQSGAIDATCRRDYYRFYALQGATCRFTFCSSVCGSTASSFTDTYLRLYNPSCTLVAQNDDSSCGGLRSDLTYTTTVAGNFVIEVAAYADYYTGTYTLGYYCTGGIPGGCNPDRMPPQLTVTPSSASGACDAPPPGLPTVTVTDNCDVPPPPAVYLGETRTPGNCPGNYTLTRRWQATDRANNTGSATQTVTIRDTVGPVGIPSLDAVACTWPPNHSMVSVDNSLLTPPSATDNCNSGPFTFALSGLNSDQCDDAPCSQYPGQNGDGTTSNDFFLAEGGQSLVVRSERCGTEEGGRHYGILFTPRDSCGNAGQPFIGGSILVPHDASDIPAGMTCIDASKAGTK